MLKIILKSPKKIPKIHEEPKNPKNIKIFKKSESLKNLKIYIFYLKIRKKKEKKNLLANFFLNPLCFLILGIHNLTRALQFSPSLRKNLKNL